MLEGIGFDHFRRFSKLCHSFCASRKMMRSKKKRMYSKLLERIVDSSVFQISRKRIMDTSIKKGEATKTVERKTTKIRRVTTCISQDPGSVQLETPRVPYARHIRSS